MSERVTGPAPRRMPLTRDRVLGVAVELADDRGLSSLTIRNLAARLEVKPMAVYHHVAGKEEILDGIVDVVFTQMALPEVGRPWREQMRARAHSARAVLGRHPWAVGLVESRTNPGPSTLRHHDAVLGTLLADGFSMSLAGHAYALLDSFLYGFAVQESSLPLGPQAHEVAAAMLAAIPADRFPHLVAFAHAQIRPGYDFGDEFDYGLELILEGLASAHAHEATARPVGLATGGG